MGAVLAQAAAERVIDAADRKPPFPGELTVGFLLEENARAIPDARIHPLTHVSVDRAYQAESVGGNSLLSTLIAIRRSPIYE